MKRLRLIRAIWDNAYPTPPREHTVIEKIFSTVTILLTFLSLSALKDRFRKNNPVSHVFMDLYVLVWAVALTLTLVYAHKMPASVGIAVAAYRLVDIVNYRLFFLLVKSQERPWTVDILRRSVAIALINFYEIVIAFAILYIMTGSVTGPGPNAPLLASRLDAFYFSLVTMATVGYGDFVPRDETGRLLVAIQISTVILFVLFLLPALVSVFSPGLARSNTDKH